MTMTTRAFSNSELKLFKRCKRKWWLSSYKRLRPKREDATGPRELGTRVHACLAAWYVPEGEERGDPFEILEDGIAADMAEYPDEADDINKEADLARAIVSGYFQWLEEEGVDAELEVIAPEQELAVNVGEVRPNGAQVILVAKMDVRIRRVTDGLLFFLDHKTVGNFTDPLKTLHMDEQMKHYLLVERIKNTQDGQDEHTAGGLYNMLRKVKRTATAKPPFYRREFITHNEHVLRSHWTEIMGVIDDILDAEERLGAGEDPKFVAPANRTRECTWDCDFFAVCHMLDDGSDAEGMLAFGYEERDPYERYDTVEQRSDG